MPTIGRYTILDKLNHSNMSMVYTCYDTLLNQKFAIKFLSPQINKNEHSIISEARILSGLTHSNIIRFFEYNLCQKTNIEYIILELLYGFNLKDFIKYNILSFKEKIKIFIQIIDAIKFIHQHNIVHLDLKPENIFIENNLTVKILDFGLSRIKDSPVQYQDSIVGSLDFISPEQIINDRISCHSDIYALGCLLYFIISDGQILDYNYDLNTKILRKRKHMTGINMAIDNTDLCDIIMLMLMPIDRRGSIDEIRSFLMNKYITSNQGITI